MAIEFDRACEFSSLDKRASDVPYSQIKDRSQTKSDSSTYKTLAIEAECDMKSRNNTDKNMGHNEIKLPELVTLGLKKSVDTEEVVTFWKDNPEIFPKENIVKDFRDLEIKNGGLGMKLILQNDVNEDHDASVFVKDRKKDFRSSGTLDDANSVKLSGYKEGFQTGEITPDIYGKIADGVDESVNFTPLTQNGQSHLGLDQVDQVDHHDVINTDIRARSVTGESSGRPAARNDTGQLSTHGVTSNVSGTQAGSGFGCGGGGGGGDGRNPRNNGDNSHIPADGNGQTRVNKKTGRDSTKESSHDKNRRCEEEGAVGGRGVDPDPGVGVDGTSQPAEMGVVGGHAHGRPIVQPDLFLGAVMGEPYESSVDDKINFFLCLMTILTNLATNSEQWPSDLGCANCVVIMSMLGHFPSCIKTSCQLCTRVFTLLREHLRLPHPCGYQHELCRQVLSSSDRDLVQNLKYYLARKLFVNIHHGDTSAPSGRNVQGVNTGMQSLPEYTPGGDVETIERAYSMSVEHPRGSSGEGVVDYGSPRNMVTLASSWFERARAHRPSNQLREEGVILHSVDQKQQILGYRYQIEYQWETLSRLGRGSFGVCHLAVDRETDNQFCVKMVRLDRFSLNEIVIWSKLTHPNIVQFFGALRIGEQIHIFAEYISGGNLTESIERYRRLKRRFSTTQTIRYMYQLLLACDYLQGVHVVNEDIKGDNIVIDEATNSLKLTDFGVAECLTGDYMDRKSNPTGTQTHWSPEKARSERYDYRSDIWSVGCVLFHILTGWPPWMRRYGNASTLVFVIATNPPPIEDVPQSVSPHLQNLLRQCWQIDLKLRPFAHTLLQYAVFSDLVQAPSGTDSMMYSVISDSMHSTCRSRIGEVQHVVCETVHVQSNTPAQERTRLVIGHYRDDPIDRDSASDDSPPALPVVNCEPRKLSLTSYSERGSAALNQDELPFGAMPESLDSTTSTGGSSTRPNMHTMQEELFDLYRRDGNPRSFEQVSYSRSLLLASDSSGEIEDRANDRSESLSQLTNEEVYPQIKHVAPLYAVHKKPEPKAERLHESTTQNLPNFPLMLNRASTLDSVTDDADDDMFGNGGSRNVSDHPHPAVPAVTDDSPPGRLTRLAMTLDVGRQTPMHVASGSQTALPDVNCEPTELRMSSFPECGSEPWIHAATSFAITPESSNSQTYSRGSSARPSMHTMQKELFDQFRRDGNPRSFEPVSYPQSLMTQETPRFPPEELETAMHHAQAIATAQGVQQNGTQITFVDELGAQITRLHDHYLSFIVLDSTGHPVRLEHEVSDQNWVVTLVYANETTGHPWWIENGIYHWQ